MKLKCGVLLLCSCLICTGCSFFPEEAPLSQLQIREIQSKTFDVADSKIVLKEMINVLQDDAFIVKQASLDMGFLFADKEVDIENRAVAAFYSISNALSASSKREGPSWNKNALIEVSANVSQFGNETRVRINFQEKIFDNAGKVVRVQQIKDPAFYQEFFLKVSKGLFLQEAQI